MPINNFLGNRKIIDILLDNEKGDYLFNPSIKKMIKIFGPKIISLCGYPITVIARTRSEDIIRMIKPILKGSLVDIGCAFGGAHTFELARRLAPNKVLGIDIDPISIHLANQLNEILKFENVQFVVGDITENLDVGEQFDIGFTVETLEHINNDSLAIKNISFMVKRYGWLLISVPYSNHMIEYDDRQNAHKQKKLTDQDLFKGGYHWRTGYNEETLIKLLSSSGFETRSVVYTKASKFIPNQPYFFPITYPLSRFVNSSFGIKHKINILARKI